MKNSAKIIAAVLGLWSLSGYGFTVEAFYVRGSTAATNWDLTQYPISKMLPKLKNFDPSGNGAEYGAGLYAWSPKATRLFHQTNNYGTNPTIILMKPELVGTSIKELGKENITFHTAFSVTDNADFVVIRDDSIVERTVGIEAMKPEEVDRLYAIAPQPMFLPFCSEPVRNAHSESYIKFIYEHEYRRAGKSLEWVTNFDDGIKFSSAFHLVQNTRNYNEKLQLISKVEGIELSPRAKSSEVRQGLSDELLKSFRPKKSRAYRTQAFQPYSGSVVTQDGTQGLIAEEFYGCQKNRYLRLDSSTPVAWSRLSEKHRYPTIASTKFFFPAPEEVEPLVKTAFAEYTEKLKLRPNSWFQSLSELSWKLASIRPFSDGNELAIQLLINHALTQQGYQPLKLPIERAFSQTPGLYAKELLTRFIDSNYDGDMEKLFNGGMLKFKTKSGAILTSEELKASVKADECKKLLSVSGG